MITCLNWENEWKLKVFHHVSQCYEVSVHNNIPAIEDDRGCNQHSPFHLIPCNCHELAGKFRKWKVPGVENDCKTRQPNSTVKNVTDAQMDQKRSRTVRENGELHRMVSFGINNCCNCNQVAKKSNQKIMKILSKKSFLSNNPLPSDKSSETEIKNYGS